MNNHNHYWLFHWNLINGNLKRKAQNTNTNIIFIFKQWLLGTWITNEFQRTMIPSLTTFSVYNVLLRFEQKLENETVELIRHYLHVAVMNGWYVRSELDAANQDLLSCERMPPRRWQVESSVNRLRTKLIILLENRVTRYPRQRATQINWPQREIRDRYIRRGRYRNIKGSCVSRTA